MAQSDRSAASARPPAPVTLDALVERKQPDLPRYLVVPSAALAEWRLEGTTVVELTMDGRPVERRTLKRWDTARWFLTVTEADCRALDIDTGHRVGLTLRPAATELPEELARLLAADPRARAVWEGRTPARRRQLAEEVARAKRPETRTRRARRALLGE